MILAAEGGSAGTAAIITAMGGVSVSLITVWLNGRKQAQATGENTGTINALTEQIAALSIEIHALKIENASLKTEITLLRGQMEQSNPKGKKPKKKGR